MSVFLTDLDSNPSVQETLNLIFLIHLKANNATLNPFPIKFQ